MTKTEKEAPRRDMFSHIRKYQDSHTSARDFYRQHNLTEHIFYYWLRKYKEGQSPVEHGFLPVEASSPILSPKNDSREGVHIHYPNGVSVNGPP